MTLPPLHRLTAGPRPSGSALGVLRAGGCILAMLAAIEARGSGPLPEAPSASVAEAELVLAGPAGAIAAPNQLAQAQTLKENVVDDPFADELNPFGKAEGRKPVPNRPGAEGRAKLPLPFPEKTVPGAPAVVPGLKDKGAAAEDAADDLDKAAAPRTRPGVRPLGRGMDDLLPFPDVLDEDEEEEVDESPAGQLLVKAEKLDRAGKYQEAKDTIQEAIKLSPKMPLAWLALGVVARHMGDFEGSVDACSAGLRIDPTDPELYLRRGIAWFHIGRHGIALEDFEDAAGIGYDDPRPELWRGLTLIEIGRPLEAISAYSSAIRRDRTYDLAYLNRGLAYLATDEPAKAESDFDQAIRHDSRNAQAWFNRGVAQARQAEYAHAGDSYSEVLRIDPKHPGARKNLDALRARTGRSGSVLHKQPAAELVPAGRVLGRPAGGRSSASGN